MLLQTENDAIKRVEELEKRVIHLEEKLRKSSSREQVSVIRTFGEGIMSLLFGLFIVGPVIAVVWTLVTLLLSWIG
ncbi:hypothetical protein QUF88_09790 [Bacillus sp. DX1.1]|uniref:hypothetical protein n=1 Tax=unclassified Bacillus (in: firmicutes) TaxID=185979 RepID=UPI002570EEAE|nr:MULTISPECIES: hypothetical protein [unclassified Bacillus (in: firmicutes)]MDM5154115.1 hypothetical protein [Bacillus sp. DX1.1]WJE83041.1 hypothetical protein QRE67_07295 [Bacillus sp. DX3.1]